MLQLHRHTETQKQERYKIQHEGKIKPSRKYYTTYFCTTVREVGFMLTLQESHKMVLSRFCIIIQCIIHMEVKKKNAIIHSKFLLLSMSTCQRQEIETNVMELTSF